MPHHHTNASRESGTYALPDLETFHHDCTDSDEPCPYAAPETAEYECNGVGWYVQACFPGCLPEGDADGPHATEANALASARESAGYCPHGVPDGAPCDDCPAPELWALCDDTGRFYYPATMDASPVKNGPTHCAIFPHESAALAYKTHHVPSAALHPVRLTDPQARYWGTNLTPE